MADRHKMKSATREKQKLLEKWDEIRLYIKARLEECGADIQIVKEEK